MAAVCELDSSGSDTLTLDISTSNAIEGDLIIFATAFAGTNPAPVTPSVGWVTQLATGSNTTARVAIFVGVVPAGPPATIDFVCGGANRGTVICQTVRGINSMGIVQDSDVFSDFTDSASISISVGPVTSISPGSYLVYALGVVSPNQANFEAGPSPTIAEQQLGRTVSLNPAVEVGIWAETINVETSATYTQTIATSQPGFEPVNGLALLFVLNPTCIG